MRRLYLDCDGVLADFDSGFESKFRMKSQRYEDKFGTKAFWTAIKEDLNFFGTLPLMSDAMELFNEVKHLRPIILTGCPFGEWAEHQKFKWRDKYFSGIPMITCLSKDKRLYCEPEDILIDDTVKYKSLWEDAGGLFILHTSAKESIKQLRKLKAISYAKKSCINQIEDICQQHNLFCNYPECIELQD